MTVQYNLPDEKNLTIYEASDQECFERRVQEEVCLVLSDTEFRHMTLRRFKDSVVYNLNRGVRYRYIIPRGIPFKQHFREFANLVGHEANVDDQHFQFVTLDPEAFGLVTPLAIFDPALPTGHGYVRHFTGDTYIWLKLQPDRLDQAFRSFQFHWQSSMPLNRSPYVFISYSSKDRETADRVAERLAKVGVEYFIDKNDIDWGGRVTDEIAHGLQRATHIMILVSPSSVQSGWVSYEVGFATGTGKKVLPLLTQPDAKPPGFLSGLHYKLEIDSFEAYFN